MIDVALPTGRWAVAVSGGADSVALLLLLHGRPDLALHVVHLDHQTRGDDSTADAAFVADLAARLGLPVTVARRSDVEHGDVLRNPSARYRQARLALFRRVVAEHGLAGVILAHHAGDQAETVMLRILRGGGSRTLVGMAEEAFISLSGRPEAAPALNLARRSPTVRSGRCRRPPDGSAAACVFAPGGGRDSSAAGGVPLRGDRYAEVLILRPLLSVPPTALRQLLRDRGQPWREDASNASDRYLRNRVRPWLAANPRRSASLCDLARAARRTRDWLDRRAPTLAASFPVTALQALPAPLARHAAGRWLVAGGVPVDAVSRAVCDRLVTMATDAATPSRQTFPGGITVRRARGWMMAAPATAARATRPPPPAR